MYKLVFQRKPCVRLINRLNTLKHVQNFSTHNSNQKKEKKKKKQGNIELTTFRNTCNIMKPFELAQGKFTDTEYDSN